MRGVHFIFKYQSSDLYWNIPKNMADKSAIKYNYYWNSFNLSSSLFNDSILDFCSRTLSDRFWLCFLSFSSLSFVSSNSFTVSL